MSLPPGEAGVLVAKANAPEPSVHMTCPALPSADGKTYWLVIHNAGDITLVATQTVEGNPIVILPSPLVISTSLVVPVTLATAGPLVPPISICPLVVRALETCTAP